MTGVLLHGRMDTAQHHTGSSSPHPPCQGNDGQLLPEHREVITKSNLVNVLNNTQRHAWEETIIDIFRHIQICANIYLELGKARLGDGVGG